INPFSVPRDLPQDPVELAMFGLRHMEPDLSARVTIYQALCAAPPAHLLPQRFLCPKTQQVQQIPPSPTS
ncbi:LOW QUALITY PROTEIN: ECSIT isoform 13, partial [Pongo abelii]